MNCRDYRDRVAIHLADPSEPTGDHGASCPDCARYAELARAAWEAAGRSPDEDLPLGLAESAWFHGAGSTRRGRNGLFAASRR